MINRLEIKNIQSHKHSTLNFSDGVNCIVGSSNNGKSAILRALYWVKYNRPLGIDSLCSHWALNDKGVQIDDMEVLVDNGNTIIRRRNKDNNMYIVNGKELNVVKSDIPDDVNNALHLSDTNIQRQLDEPFLLSRTGGEVAKYFNSIVRIDVIDKVLSNAENIRRKNNREVESLNEIIKEQEEKLEGFKWLDECNELIEKFENLNEKYEKYLKQGGKLEDDICQYKQYSLGLYDCSKSKGILDEIEKVSKEKEETEDTINTLEDNINYIKGIKDYSQLFSIKHMITNIEELEEEKKDVREQINTLADSINAIKECENKIKNNNLEIVRLNEQLPNICPLCGGKMNG